MNRQAAATQSTREELHKITRSAANTIVSSDKEILVVTPTTNAVFGSELTLNPHTSIGIHSLHPTLAVCLLNTSAARNLIDANHV